MRSDTVTAAAVLERFDKLPIGTRLPLEAFRKLVKEIKKCQTGPSVPSGSESAPPLRLERSASGLGVTVGTVFRQYDGGNGVIAARDMGMALYDLGIPSDAKAQALDVLSRLGTQQFTLGEFRSFIKSVKAGKVGVLVSGGA